MKKTLKETLGVFVIGGGLLVSMAPASAHHSFAAEYDANKPCKLTGTVSKFDLTNPPTGAASMLQ